VEEFEVANGDRARMFHNCGMIESSYKSSTSNKQLLYGLGFAILSLCSHAVFVAWVGGALEVSSWSPPLRDTVITVSLSSIKQPAPSAPESANKNEQVVPLPVRKRQIISKSDPTTSADQSLGQTKVNVDELPVSRDETKPEVKSELPERESIRPELQVETGPELKNDRAALTDQPIYSGGLGSIPVAGAFPYTFYYGDYSLNNALGSGSFIVESGDGKYKLVLIGKASGLTSLIFSGATYRSEGMFGNDGFAPQLYAEKSGNRAERVALVDYSTKEVTFGDQKKAALLGMQDRVSVIWQVGLVLKAKSEFIEKGMTLPIPLMSARSLDNAQFISQGLVDIDKRGVLVKAAHFKFKPSNPLNKAQIDLWYDLNNLPQPLRIRWIDERDRTIDIFRDD
jgi:Protein of unknown function (DUF3108)